MTQPPEAAGGPDPAHVPVLLERCVALLAPALTAASSTGHGAVVVDCTLGMGGHAEALLAALPGVRLVGIDRDPEALRRSGERLAPYARRTTLVHAVYDQLPEVLAGLDLACVAGVLFDLGVSSLQLDEADRGFAYAQDAPLDMRMDPTTGATAADVVNGYDGKALARVLKEYGEERFASRIADAIVREETTNAGLDHDIWQFPVVLLADVRSVGVQGDGRTYGHPVVLRPVSSEDAMTADWSRVPYDVLARISNRITNEVPEVNRVVLDVTSKPPGTIEWE